MQSSCFRTSQLQILYCYNCSVLHSRDLPEWSIVKSEVQNLVHNIRPFNLHPDFWNRGLQKSRSISNPRKMSGSANLGFFRFGTLIFFRVETWKKIKVCRPWHFSRVWNRPWFSEIRVQIKRSLDLGVHFLRFITTYEW